MALYSLDSFNIMHKDGDEITLLYSTIGLTYVIKARINKLTSRDTKVRNIAPARLWALDTTSLTCSHLYRLCCSVCLLLTKSNHVIKK